MNYGSKSFPNFSHIVGFLHYKIYSVDNIRQLSLTYSVLSESSQNTKCLICLLFCQVVRKTFLYIIVINNLSICLTVESQLLPKFMGFSLRHGPSACSLRGHANFRPLDIWILILAQKLLSTSPCLYKIFIVFFNIAM